MEKLKSHNLVKPQNGLKFIFLILFVLSFNNTLFSQETDQQDSATTQVNSAFENNTNYFAESSSQGETENAASTTYKAPSTAGMIIKMVVVLALVVAALYGILRFFKKRNSNTQSDDDFMRRVSSLSFAPGKSVEIVTLVDRAFMLGVTESSINLITEITDKEMISAMNLNFDKKKNTKKPMNFSDVLDMFMPNGPRGNQNIYSNTEQTVEQLSRNSVDNGEAENTNENA